jgi:hypothetical protein
MTRNYPLRRALAAAITLLPILGALVCPASPAGPRALAGRETGTACSVDAAGSAPEQAAQDPGAAAPAKRPSNGGEPERRSGERPPEGDGGKRIELNLLGKTDAAAGESRRNENIQFNLVDNNALKELNIRLGTTATIVREFNPARSYFGAEFGSPPSPVLTLPARIGAGIHGGVRHLHANSIFSARSFFQVGDVEPARENDYGFTLGLPVGSKTRVFLDAGQSKLRGSVNGNVLVPKADEREPLTTDPQRRALVARWLAAYPRALPNRTDVNPRALNTNSPQSIDNANALLRLDRDAGSRDRFSLLYQLTTQRVDAFQLVAGQNPDTSTRAHGARIGWTRIWSAATSTEVAVGFDRLGSYLRPEEHSVGPMVSVAGLETLGPQGTIPIERAQNLFRYSGQWRRASGAHAWRIGFGVVRRQLNGLESDANRGFWSFTNDFGRDGITNFRLGTPSQHIVTRGNTRRGFRNWDLQLYAGDTWKASRNLTLDLGLRYQPVTSPTEVNHLSEIQYGCDCNNVAPQVGIAYRLARRWGVLRAAYGLHHGEIFPVTFSQARFSPPTAVKLVVVAPDLLDPLGAPAQDGMQPRVLGNKYLLDPDLATPYSHQYNLSWEPELSQSWKLQLGYVGSRSHKLLIMWYGNRAHPVPGIDQTTATINLRRPDPNYAEIRRVVNGSRGYFDAARVSVVGPRWHGLSTTVSYWFSKALDLGSSYTNTASDADSRLARSQWEYETQRDMRGLSSFDQTHAFLWTGSYALPNVERAAWLSRVARDWTLSAVVLAKSGIPFNLMTPDGPGFGNVDGNGGDRPNLVDPSVVGRSIDDPDTSRLLLPRAAFAYMRPTDPRGNLGRNVFRKGGIHNVNAALARSWGLRRDMKLTFRAESINLFNTPQFAEPGSDLGNGNFGAITNTLNDGRAFRFQAALGW